MAEKLKVALLGFGGMGHYHAARYKDLVNCELVAVCDIDEKQFENLSASINIGSSGEAALTNVRQYLSYEDLIAHEKPDFIDICLPCHLHAEYAIRAMKDGFHVLVEKPMARTTKQADEMLRVARETGKKLMVAQCLRFMGTFNAIKEAYDSGKYGRLLRMDLRRNSSLPSAAWYRDATCSGGALLDLHLHDTDFVNYMLGVPESVRTCGISRASGGIDDLMTTYTYSGGPIVNAEASWCRSGWHNSAAAIFEQATVELIDGKLTVARPDEPVEELAVTGEDPYGAEIDYFAACILKNCAPEQCSPESTRESIRIALSEEKSALSKREVEL